MDKAQTTIFIQYVYLIKYAYTPIHFYYSTILSGCQQIIKFYFIYLKKFGKILEISVKMCYNILVLHNHKTKFVWRKFIKMGIFEIISAIVLIIACVFIVVVVLLKDTKTQMSQTISGTSSDTFYQKNAGRTKEAMLNKATIVAVILFFVMAIAVNVINVYFGASKGSSSSTPSSSQAAVSSSSSSSSGSSSSSSGSSSASGSSSNASDSSSSADGESSASESTESSAESTEGSAS